VRVPTGYIDQTLLDEAVGRAIKKLGPEVVRVRYSVGADTDGDPALFFRIVLTDAAVRRKESLGNVVVRTRRTLYDDIHPQENWGLIPYTSFRSASEVAKQNDPDWA
jgi:hypothetical protein